MGACSLDAGRAGLRVLYLGGEITEGEFNYRARKLAEHRGEELTADLVETWSRVRYELLADALRVAWDNPDDWRDRVAELYDVVVADPMSSIASALGFDFIQSDTDFNRFYDRLIEPLRNAGKVVVIPDNVGHADEAKGRPKGVSAKLDRPDVLLATSAMENPDSLLITCEKARSERRPFNVGDSWDFDEATRRLRFIPRGQPVAVERLADPAEQAAAKGDDRRAQVLARLRAAGEPISKREIKAHVKGRHEWVDDAIGELLTAGAIEATHDFHPKFFALPDPREAPRNHPFGSNGGGRGGAGASRGGSYPEGVTPQGSTAPATPTPAQAELALAASQPEPTKDAATSSEAVSALRRTLEVEG
jgi:hypothetical protein